MVSQADGVTPTRGAFEVHKLALVDTLRLSFDRNSRAARVLSSPKIPLNLWIDTQVPGNTTAGVIRSSNGCQYSKW